MVRRAFQEGWTPDYPKPDGDTLKVIRPETAVDLVLARHPEAKKMLSETGQSAATISTLNVAAHHAIVQRLVLAAQEQKAHNGTEQCDRLEEEIGRLMRNGKSAA